MFNTAPKKAGVIAGQPLTEAETTIVERVLRMAGGYSLDFSDRTIKSFFGEFGVDILAVEYADGPTGGKANRVRSFLRKTRTPLVGQVMMALLDHGIQTNFSDRDDDTAKPTEGEISSFRTLAVRFGGGVARPKGRASPTAVHAPQPEPMFPTSPLTPTVGAGGIRAPSTTAPAPEFRPARPQSPAPQPHSATTTPALRPGATSGRRFRVALSFAGERRTFVHDVAHIIARVFGTEAVLYDKFHEAELARPDLGIYLPNLYNKDSDLVVVVVCPDYDRKGWTGLEWLAIHDLLKQRKHEEVMLCRFGFASVDGLFSTSGFVELDDKVPTEVARLILERLAINEGIPRGAYFPTAAPTLTSAVPAAAGSVPSTYDEADILSILETWWDSRSRSEKFAVIDVESVDTALRLPSGSAARHLETVAAGPLGLVKVRRRGSRTILFYEDALF